MSERRLTPRPSAALPAALTVIVVAGLLRGPQPLPALVLGVLAAIIAGYVVVIHPQSVFRVTAFVLAGAPLLPAPGLGAPLVLILGIAVWAALPMSERPPWRPGWVEAFVALSVIASGVSVLVTSPDAVSIVEYGRWVIAFSLVIPLRALGVVELVAFGRAFVAGSAAGALVGILIVLVDRHGRLLDQLTAFGYDVRGGNLRIVQGSESTAVRLTGTYVDPNMGGFVLAVGLILAVALLRGTPRLAVSAVIGTATVLTLSRTSIATVVVAVVIVIIAGRLTSRARLGLLAAGGVATIGALAIPSVRLRLLDSFGPTDAGSQARWAAYHDFLSSMRGHWWFGKGWGIDEFRDPAIAQVTNYVANAPLLTVYRAGIVVGAIFVVLLLVGALRSISLLRHDLAPSVVGAGFLAVVLVALQLDFPVALLPPATMSFAVLLAFVSHDRWSGHETAEAR